ILATSDKIIPGRKIIVSADKDMKTIPGEHYDPNKRELGVVTVSRLEADGYHMMQTLTGDTTDGYTGCPGVGPKKAEKILGDEPHLWWHRVVEAYDKAGLSEAEALTQARVARILRATDYDFKLKKPILWTPPGAA